MQDCLSLWSFFLGYFVGIFRLAKYFHKSVVSNTLSDVCYEVSDEVPRKDDDVFWYALDLWIWSDHSVEVHCTFPGIRTFRILLKLFYVLTRSFSVHLYFSHNIFCSNTRLTWFFCDTCLWTLKWKNEAVFNITVLKGQETSNK